MVITHLRRKFTGLFAALFAGLALCAPGFSTAADENTLVEGAKLCTRYLPRHERQYGIPEHLLAAIASTESGRFHRGLGLNLPWPWTINVNGRGYFFDTKEEAVAAVKKLMGEGYQSIDVGCMQVNLRHHPKAFSSIEQAFDPGYNIGYAASFLKRNFADEGSWRKATAYYHSRTYSFGTPYANQVFNAWGKIVAKVADARAGRPVLNSYASNSKTKPAEKTLASRVRPSYRSLRMHSITVAKKATATRENGVLVIRPQKSQEILIQPDNANPLVAKASELRATAAPASSSGRAKSQPKIINLADRISQPSSGKGQFEPRPRTATTAALPDSADGDKRGNKLFVFDN